MNKIMFILIFFIRILWIATGLQFQSFHSKLQSPRDDNGREINGIPDFMNNRYKPSNLYLSKSSLKLSSSIDNQIDELVYRKLGSYERLLSRQSADRSLCISHGCAVLLKGILSESLLLQAMEYCIQKHPMLRVYIENGKWIACTKSMDQMIESILSERVVLEDMFDCSWNQCLEDSFNSPKFPKDGPLWRLIHIKSPYNQQHAFVFTFNHGTDDQQSLNIVISDILDILNGKRIPNVPNSLSFPLSIEQAIAPPDSSISSSNTNSGSSSITTTLPSLSTVKWAIYQLSNSLQNPMVLPVKVIERINSNEEYRNKITNPRLRGTLSSTFDIDLSTFHPFLSQCKSNQVTITQALAASVLSLTSDLISSDINTRTMKLRFLLSVGLRKFVSSSIDSSTFDGDWTNHTVASASGAVDFDIDVSNTVRMEVTNIRERKGGKKSNSSSSSDQLKEFWKLARLCKKKSAYAINDMNFVPESVRLFDLGMNYVDIFQAIELESRNPKTLGRGYTCSVSNVGIVQMKSNNSNNDDIQVKGIYYGTSQAESGVLVQLSCGTINGNFHACIQFPYPIISRSEANDFMEKLKTFLINMST